MAARASVGGAGRYSGPQAGELPGLARGPGVAPVGGVAEKRYRFERDHHELDGEGEAGQAAEPRPVAPGKVSRASQLGHLAGLAAPVAPGKRAPTTRIGLPAAPAGQVSLQHRRARGTGVDEREELAIAARGLADAGGPLPYLEELQRAFGRHDLRGIRVASGGEASSANQQMRSVAYAMGDAIVLRDSSPDLFTVAHEAAHVIQQRAGAVAAGTVGQSGDRHEAHADAVAERVVRGESAEDLLDQVAPGAAPSAAPSAPSGLAPVQRLDDEDYEGLTAVQAIHTALDDDESDDALALMRRLDGAGEANVVLSSYQSLATGCFGDNELAEAARILVSHGGSLSRALDWMYDEGTDWLSVVDLIASATPGQRAALKTEAWRDHFVGELDDEEMSELVDLLGFGLYDQLDWMSVEGTNWDAVRGKIVAAPAAERAELVTDGWRDWFAEEVVDSEEMTDLVDLLGMDLASKLEWMYAVGTDDQLILAKVQAAPAEQRATLVTDGWLDWFFEEFDDDSMARLVDVIGMPLVTKLDWLRAVDADVEVMIGKIVAAPADQRPAVYDSDLRDLFVGGCNDEEMAVLVILLGGTLAQQLSWMAAEGSSAELVLDRVNAAPADQRPAIHDDSAVVEMIRDFEPRERTPIIEAAGGTPAQQMDLFGAETHIRLLTWATPSADWVDAILAVRESPLDLFEVAKGDPATWGPLIQPKLWDLLASHQETLYPEDRIAVFWAAYGTGTIFTADQIMHFFRLVFGREIQPASEDVTFSPGLMTRTRFSVVAPTTATAQGLMDCVRPGGGGPSGIGRAEVRTGTIAFCTHEHEEELGITGWTTLASKVIETSYFADPYVIIRAVGPDPKNLGVQPGVASTNPLGTASDGTPEAVGTGLTYFQNHVRHEIGHAIGALEIGDMTQSGNDFARGYGDWQVSSQSEFLAAMWSGQSEPATGWPPLAIGAASVTVSDDEVRDWCVAVISSGTEPNNALGADPGTFAQKTRALAGSIWSGEKMVALLRAIPCSKAEEVPGSAYEFPGFTPPSPVPIFSTRWGNRFVTYSTEAYNAFTGISWYARSSPVEMFAEMYTARYGGGALPPATSGGDPDAFFTELEAQRDPMFGEPAPDYYPDGR